MKAYECPKCGQQKFTIHYHVNGQYCFGCNCNMLEVRPPKPQGITSPIAQGLQDEIDKAMDRIAQAQHSMAIPKIFICNHEYKQYVGLTEQYSYCTKCDHKESV